MPNQGVVEVGAHGANDRHGCGSCRSQQQVDEAIDIGGVLGGSFPLTAGRRLRVEFLPLVDIQQQPVRLAFRLVQLLTDHVRQQLGIARP